MTLQQIHDAVHLAFQIGAGLIAALIVGKVAYDQRKLKKDDEKLEKLEFSKEVERERARVEMESVGNLIDDLDCDGQGKKP